MQYFREICQNASAYSNLLYENHFQQCSLNRVCYYSLESSKLYCLLLYCVLKQNTIIVCAIIKTIRFYYCDIDLHLMDKK